MQKLASKYHFKNELVKIKPKAGYPHIHNLYYNQL